MSKQSILYSSTESDSHAHAAQGLCFTGTVISPAVILSERSCHALNEASPFPGNSCFLPYFSMGCERKTDGVCKCISLMME